jgi:hypothetical protein
VNFAEIDGRSSFARTADFGGHTPRVGDVHGIHLPQKFVGTAAGDPIAGVGLVPHYRLGVTVRFADHLDDAAARGPHGQLNWSSRAEPIAHFPEAPTNRTG